MLRRHRHRAKDSAKCEAAGIAHEHRRWWRIKPQEREARTNNRAAQDRQIPRTRHIRNAEIASIFHIADQIGDQHERKAGNDHWHRRKPVKPVGQVHRIAKCHHDGGRKNDIQPAKITHRPFIEWQIKLSARCSADHVDCKPCYEKFKHEPHLARNALMAALLDLVIIIHEPNKAKAAHYKQAGPDVIIGQIHPKQHRDAD